MSDEGDERVTLRGTITLSHPDTRAATVEAVEFRAGASFREPASLRLRLEGALGELAKLQERVPALAPLFPPVFDPMERGVVELLARPDLLAELRAVALPDEAPMDVNALLSCEPWARAAFDLGRYDAGSVGVGASHEIEEG